LQTPYDEPIHKMRLFIAIDLPDAILNKLEPLSRSTPAGRPSAPEQMHLTLFFLGEVPEENVAGIIAALQTIRVTPFSLKLEGVGCFPSPNRPRILWVGISPTPTLHDLKKQIDAALIPLGFTPDKKPFHPHLTLARIKNPWVTGIPKFLEEHRSFNSEEFVVDSFHLYSSTLSPAGSLYSKVKGFELR
jgi:2'-5' RNA ligase